MQKNSAHKKPASTLRLYLCLVAYLLGVMLFFRLVFWCYTVGNMAAPLGADAFKAFFIGLRFDARIAALFTLPLGLLLCLPRAGAALHRKASLVTALYAPLFFLLFTVYAIDFGFYSYLGSRVNSLLFELLQDFGVAVSMVSQSYPLFWIIFGLFAATGLALFAFYRLLRVPALASSGKAARAAGFLGGFFIFTLCVYGQLDASLFPLRWSNAHFTAEESIIALGLNPVQSLYDTSRVSTRGPDHGRVKEAYPAMAAFLLPDAPDREALSYERRFFAREGERSLNVVIVVMESLAYNKTSFAPRSADPTPNLKRLAGESLLFHNFFANARTTARAVFTIMTGIPDVNEGSTASRNPLVVDQRIVPNEFTEHDKYYLIGGSASWANIRAVLAQNVQGLKIREEGDWKSPSADVWGVSDYDLFLEAHELFSSRSGGKPFFALIQMASYHKPYTVPKTPGFAPAQLTAEDALTYGFESEGEYNSMRYADHAVGEFMRLAKNSAYYDNTVFFILGDHGLNEQSGNLKGGYKAAGIWPWHVPMIIHAAPGLGLVNPGESYMPCSHVDVMPTAAALAGIAYRDYTLGRDIFDERYAASRAVYIGGKEGTPVRLVWDDYCYFDNLLGVRGLYRLQAEEGVNPAAEDPERLERYARLADDIDATARYMLFNNRKQPGWTGKR